MSGQPACPVSLGRGALARVRVETSTFTQEVVLQRQQRCQYLNAVRFDKTVRCRPSQYVSMLLLSAHEEGEMFHPLQACLLIRFQRKSLKFVIKRPHLTSISLSVSLCLPDTTGIYASDFLKTQYHSFLIKIFT